jgi:hypothetical protein
VNESLWGPKRWGFCLDCRRATVIGKGGGLADRRSAAGSGMIKAGHDVGRGMRDGWQIKPIFFSELQSLQNMGGVWTAVQNDQSELHDELEPRSIYPQMRCMSV